MGFFSKTETHPEAKSLATYYDELASLVRNIRELIPNADDDPAFKQAAGIFEKVVTLCRDMETMSPVFVPSVLKQRSALMHQIGPEGRLGIQGEASRFLAANYIQMTKDTRDKKYWPSEKANKIFRVEYANNFEKEVKPRAQQGIEILEKRIAEYDQKLREQRAAQRAASSPRLG